MAERKQVRDLTGPQPLRPTAAPVDTYYRPAENEIPKPLKSNSFTQLGEALAEIQPGINRFLKEKHKEYTEDELRKGARARVENQTRFKEAVDQGLIPEAASPWFLKGYMQQEGRLDGIDYDTKLRLAWSQSPVSNSDDPEEISKFIADHRSTYLKERDDKQSPDWFDGFEPMMSRAENNLTAQHIAHRQSEISKRVRENTATEVGAVLDLEFPAGLPTDPITKTEGIIRAGRIIQERVDGLIKNGLSGSDANKIVVDSIITKAVEQRDTEVLNVLDHVGAGPGRVLGKTGYAREKRQAAEMQIVREKEHEIRWQWALEDRPYEKEAREWARVTRQRSLVEWSRSDREYSKKIRGEALVSDAITSILEDPTRDVSAYIGKAAKVDPGYAGTIFNFHNAYLNNKERIVEDRDFTTEVMYDMVTNPDTFKLDRIFQGVTDKKYDVPRMMQLYDQYQRVKESASHPLMRDPIVREIEAGLERGVSTDALGRITGTGGFDAKMALVELKEYERELLQSGEITASDFRNKVRAKATELFKTYNEFAGESKVIKKEGGQASPGQQSQATPQDTPQVPSPIIKAYQAAKARGDAQAVEDIINDYPQIIQVIKQKGNNSGR